MPKNGSAELTLRQQALLLLITDQERIEKALHSPGREGLDAAIDVLKVLGIFEVSDGKLQEFIGGRPSALRKALKGKSRRSLKAFDGESTKTEGRV